MSAKRLRECIWEAASPRLHTWSLAEMAYGFLDPRRGGHWKQNPIMAAKCLDKLWRVLGHAKYDVDPIIAEDFGGEALIRLRIDIKEAIEQLELGEIKQAKDIIHRIRRKLFEYSMRKFAECLQSSDAPDKGVSTTHKLRKMMRGEEVI